MGKYADMMARLAADPVIEVREPETDLPPQLASTGSLVPIPALPDVLGSVMRCDALHAISERLAPMAAVDATLRLAVAGCRPGDGVSTVATALAVDLSQRLSLRTVLVDAHIRHPSLHRFFRLPKAQSPELVLDGSLQIRSSGWPRLDLASCCLEAGDAARVDVLRDFEGLLPNYQAAVVDIGTPRLDARMLPLARSNDPILLVVKYGHTERKELINTTLALRAANRSIAGVILNAKPDLQSSAMRSLQIQ